MAKFIPLSGEASSAGFFLRFLVSALGEARAVDFVEELRKEANTTPEAAVLAELSKIHRKGQLPAAAPSGFELVSTVAFLEEGARRLRKRLDEAIYFKEKAISEFEGKFGEGEDSMKDLQGLLCVALNKKDLTLAYTDFYPREDGTAGLVAEILENLGVGCNRMKELAASLRGTDAPKPLISEPKVSAELRRMFMEGVIPQWLPNLFDESEETSAKVDSLNQAVVKLRTQLAEAEKEKDDLLKDFVVEEASNHVRIKNLNDSLNSIHMPVDVDFQQKVFFPPLDGSSSSNAVDAKMKGLKEAADRLQKLATELEEKAAGGGAGGEAAVNE